MDQAVKPVGERPLLVWAGAAFTRIVVATTTDLNGGSHHVMFIGTSKDHSYIIKKLFCWSFLKYIVLFYQSDSGSVLKAVNYDGEVVIIEEIQLFESSQPIKILRLSNTMVTNKP